MQRLLNFVVFCACASLSVPHVLVHTTSDLVAFGGLSDAVIEQSDVRVNLLDVVMVYTASPNSVVGAKRYHRSIIETSSCPEGQVKLFNWCVTCLKYKQITEEDDCPFQ